MIVDARVALVVSFLIWQKTDHHVRFLRGRRRKSLSEPRQGRLVASYPRAPARMGACVSRRGDRAECRRCARLPPPSSASPFADAVADAALVRAPPKRRASFALGRSRGVFPLTASALARKALEEGDARDASDSDEDWRSARSAQTTRSSIDDTGDTGASETAGNLETFETFDGTSPDLRDFRDFSRRPRDDARFDSREKFDTRDPSRVSRHERKDTSSRTALMATMEMDASSSVLGRAQPSFADVEEREKSQKVSRKTPRRARRSPRSNAPPPTSRTTR